MTGCASPRDLVVRALSQRAEQGWLTLGDLRFACALGRAGLTHRKREGDGATPVGRWRVERILWRADRAPFAVRGIHGHGFTSAALRADDGWCDAVGDRNYNRPVRHPYPVSAEHLVREDHLYDVVVILGYNRCPRVMGRGSAIFLHLARAQPDDGPLVPTAGCIALRRRDLAVVLRHLKPGVAVTVVG